MSDVEFLEPDDERDTPAQPAPPHLTWHLARRVPPALIALAASLAAGVLTVLAAFATAYRIRLTGIEASEGGGGYRLDGWGRYEPGSDSVGQHGPRLGILLCAAAGLVVIGLALWLVSLRRGRRWRSIGSGLVLVASGAVLAAAASNLLSALASADSYRAALRAADFTRPDGTQPRPRLYLELGGLLWLGLAATVLLWVAVVAAALVRAEAPAADQSPTRPEPPAEPPPLHRDDELLGG